MEKIKSGELIIPKEVRKALEEEEKAGRAFVIRPRYANDIGRIEKDRQKLEALYRLGYQDAKKHYGELVAFLKKEKEL